MGCVLQRCPSNIRQDGCFSLMNKLVPYDTNRYFGRRPERKRPNILVEKCGNDRRKVARKLWYDLVSLKLNQP